MAAGTPLTEITLGAASVADDLGYVALSDLARALGGLTDDFRVIGGHMVTVLAARWQLGPELYRETGDVDLGIPPVVDRSRSGLKSSHCSVGNQQGTYGHNVHLCTRHHATAGSVRDVPIGGTARGCHQQTGHSPRPAGAVRVRRHDGRPPGAWRSYWHPRLRRPALASPDAPHRGRRAAAPIAAQKSSCPALFRCRTCRDRHVRGAFNLPLRAPGQ